MRSSEVHDHNTSQHTATLQYAAKHCNNTTHNTRPPCVQARIHTWYQSSFLLIYDTPQHTATQCNTMQTPQRTATHCNTLQQHDSQYSPPMSSCFTNGINYLVYRFTTHRNTRQHTITQHTATYYNTHRHRHNYLVYCFTTHRNIPQHTAHPATHFNTPQHTATHCNTPQRTATHCNNTTHNTRPS